MSEYVLEARSIVKSFPGVKALSHVDFGVKPGEVHALVGENGAGKSTLMMVLGGIYRPDDGEIYVDGKKMNFLSARDSIDHGVGIVFQELSLVPQLSVAENIYFNRQPIQTMGMVNRKKLYTDTEEMLRRFDMRDIKPTTLVRDLSIANQQVVEILKAMSESPKVIVLDEPTSSLAEAEVQRLFRNIRKLKDEGIAFIYISHHLSEIFDIADTVTVLRDGQMVVTRPVSEVDEDYLINHMVGRCIVDVYENSQADSGIGDIVFQAEGLCGKNFEDVSFDVRAGEIVGFSGLVGAGRTEVGRAIFAADSLKTGKMKLERKPYAPHSSQHAIAQGVGYMTEDRKSLGLYLNFDISQNLAANRLSAFSKNGIMQDRALAEETGRTISDYGVVTTSVHKKVSELSGGNQQKVLLAAWMSIHPKLLIVDEPTRGVDVGAKFEIYQILRRMAREQHCGIMMISSDLPEVLGLSDRIVVMKDGHVTGVLEGKTATENSVMSLAAGSEKEN